MNRTVAFAAVFLVACGPRYRTRLEPICPAAQAVNRLATVSETTIRGIVRNRDTGSSLADAYVELLPGMRHAMTDSTGAFAFLDVADGRYVLRTRRLGYEERQDTIVVRQRTGINAQLALTPAYVDPCFEMREVRTLFRGGTVAP